MLPSVAAERRTVGQGTKESFQVLHLPGLQGAQVAGVGGAPVTPGLGLPPPAQLLPSGQPWWPYHKSPASPSPGRAADGYRKHTANT